MYSKTTILLASVAITGVVLVGIAPTASAKQQRAVVTAPDPDAPTRRVSYADLNLASLQGEKVLIRRVGGAVTGVCQEATNGMGYAERGKCYSFAWRGARPQIEQVVQRAREIALTGRSSIAAAAITLSFPQ